MAETTDYDDEVSRDEAADLLQELARELRGDDSADVRVGNKRVTLTPGQVIDYEIEVEERSPVLGGNRQEVVVNLEWDADEEG